MGTELHRTRIAGSAVFIQNELPVVLHDILLGAFYPPKKRHSDLISSVHRTFGVILARTSFRPFSLRCWPPQRFFYSFAFNLRSRTTYKMTQKNRNRPDNQQKIAGGNENLLSNLVYQIVPGNRFLLSPFSFASGTTCAGTVDDSR